MKRGFLIVLLLVSMGGMVVAGCGRKGPPKPPAQVLQDGPSRSADAFQHEVSDRRS